MPLDGVRLTGAGAWQRRGGDSLALVAGASLPLAFAPFNFYLLGLLAPALLFWMWRDVTPGRAAWRGWLFGLGQFGVGVSWVYISIYTFGHAPVVVTLGLTVAFIAFLALYPAVLGALSLRWFPVDDRWRRLIVWPAAWALLEWLRGWLLSGFPWLAIGYSQTDTPLAAYAPVLGVFGVSWLLAVGAAAVTLLPRISAMLVLLAIVFGGVALERVAWTHAAGPPRKVALIQGNISQAVKWQAEQREPTLELYRDLTRAHWNNDLIVWPETAVPIFYDQVAKTFIADMQAEARAHHVDLLLGIPVQDAAGNHYYNAMMSLGARQDFYRKRHLVPFGEYLPLRPLLGWLLDYLHIPMSDFSAGPIDQPLVHAAGHAAGLSICYEDAFGEETINDLPAAAYLVNVSNDAWFGDSLAPHQHLQIARLRALETGRYLLRATNTGISAIIGPQGQVLARSPQFQVTVLSGVMQPMAGATPYVRWGNYALVSLLVSLLVAAFWQRYRQRGRVEIC
ncbi:MAG: apolipoprotein N-acyltransferase [Gammaproteobacteria bacterium]